MSIELVIQFFGLLLALIAGYAAIRDLIDKKDKVQADRLQSQTEFLTIKLDKVQEGITAACISTAKVETTVAAHGLRLDKIEDIVFTPNHPNHGVRQKVQ